MSEAALFKSQLGETWNDVDERIQTRFNVDPKPSAPVYYNGTMTKVECTKLGAFLAHMSFFTTGALCPYNGENVEAEIKVYKKEGCDDIRKTRIYHFPNKQPYIFESRMSLNLKGELLEYVGAGFGMKIKVQEKNGALYFTDQGYFIDFGLFRIPLPRLLSPGDVHLIHENTGENQFKIIIDIIHPIFGQLYYQEGVFNDAVKQE